MDADALRRRLSGLARKTATATALGPFAYWDGDKAAERQVRDDFAAGRAHWRSAHSAAKLGLDALDKDDRQGASEFLWIATDFYISALERRIRQEDLQVLGKPAAKRGRPQKKSATPQK